MAGQIKGIIVEIGGNTVKLTDALNSTQKQSRSLQKELRGVNSLLKLDPKNTELLAQKQEILTEEIKNTSEKLNKLKSVQKQVQEQFDKGEITNEQYRDFQREIINTEKRLEKLKDEQKEFGSVAKQQMKIASDKMDSFGGKTENAGKKLTVATGAVVALGAAAVKTFTELDEGYDTIVTKTGATGEALDGLNNVADNVFGSMPTEMSDVGVAVGEVNTRFKVTDEALEHLSTTFLQFAEINGTDLNNSIGNTQKIMSAWNVETEKTDSLLGLITKKAQDTGIGVDTLMQSMITNEAVFKEMNLGLEESISLMAQFEANGVDASQGLMGLKRALANATAEGKPLSDALADNINKIKNAKTSTEALEIATELFGTKGAGEMATAIRENRINIDELSESMESYATTVEETYNGTLDPIDNAKIAANNFKLALSELAAVGQESVSPMLEEGTDKVRQFSKWFKELDDDTKQNILRLGLLVAAIGPVTMAVGKATKAISAFMSTSIYTKAAILAVVAGLAAYKAMINATTPEVNELAEETHAAYDEFKEFKEAQEETYDSIEKESAYLQDLRDELKLIVDENGNVKAGYKDRYDFIMNELTTALGIELEDNEGIKKSYQDICAEIDNLIDKRRAELLLDAQAEAYKTATIELMDAEAKQAEHLADISEKSAEYEKAYQKALAESGNAYVAMMDNKVTKARKALEESQTAYNENQEQIAGYYDAITLYEKNYTAVSKGEYDKVITTLEGTEDAYENTAQAQIDAMQKVIAYASGEGKDALEEVADNWKKAGKISGNALIEGFLEGLNTKEADLKTGIYGFGDSVIRYSNQSLQINSPSKRMVPVGEGTIEGYMVGVDNKRSELKSKIMGISKEVIDTSNSSMSVGNIDIPIKTRNAAVSNAIIGTSTTKSNASGSQSKGSEKVPKNIVIPLYINGKKFAETVAPYSDAVNGFRASLKGGGVNIR